MSFDPDKPYNDLPLLPPKAELETKAVLRKTIAANKALAELRGGGVCFHESEALRPAARTGKVICPENPYFWTRFWDMSKPWTCPCQNSYGFR
jgi:hypothetical protein